MSRVHRPPALNSGPDWTIAGPGTAKPSASTTWTAGNGNWNTAANWSNGVPAQGVDAYIQGLSTNPLTVTFSSGNDKANSLSTNYTDLAMSGGTLTLQYNSGLQNSGAAFTQTGGLIDFQNGESQNQASTITGNGNAVTQSAGTIQIDQGSLVLYGNSVFAGTISTVAATSGGALQLDGGATYIFNKGAALTVGELVVSNGTAIINGGVSVQTAELAVYNSATLVLGGSLNYGGFFNDISDGFTDLNLAKYTLTLTGQADIGSSAYSASITGAGTLVLDGASALGQLNNGGGTYIGGSTAVINNGSVTQNGYVQVGDGSGGLASVTNAAKGVWTVVAGSTLGVGSDASSSFTNDGVFTVTGGNNTVTVNPAFLNAGTIAAAATETINFNGVLANAGTISGAGQVAINGGGATLNAGTVLSVAEFGLYNSAALTLTTNLSYAGFFADISNGFNDLYLENHTLTLTGGADFGSANYTATLEGPGTLSLKGTSTIGRFGAGSGFAVVGGATLINSGTVTQDGPVQIGDGTLSAIINASKAIWNLTTGDTIFTGSNANSSFTNAGLFETTGSLTSPVISAAFNNTGTISIAGGDGLGFDNVLTNSGTISGAGQVYVTGGTMTLAAGTVLTAGTFGVYDSATVDLATNLTYAGVFDDISNGFNTLNLGGNTLSLTGTADIGSSNYTASIDGAGTLALSGTTSLGTFGNGSGFDLGGTAMLTNSGTVTQSGGVTIGDGNGGAAGVINSGTWKLTTNNGIGIGNNTASFFTNAGLFENLGNADTLLIDPVFTNTGTISAVNAGETITFEGGGNFGGTLGGAGGIAFAGGHTYAITKGASLTVANFGLYDNGTHVTLASNFSYGGAFTEAGGTALTLGGNLTLTGSAALNGLILGSSKLTISGNTASLNTNGLTLGGAVSLVDSKATISQSAQWTIGDTAGSTASLNVLAHSTYRITADVGIGSNGTGAIINAGLFEKSAGTGTSLIDPLVTNTGTIASASGTLAFVANVTNDGTLMASGGNSLALDASLSSLTGKSGVIDLSNGGLARFGGYVGSSQTLTFLDGSIAEATLGTAGQFAATISGFGGGNLIDLAGVQNFNASFANGMLTLTATNNGATLAELHFTGSYSLTSFTFKSDNGSGTVIGYTTGAGHHG